MFIAYLLAVATQLPPATPIDPGSWFSPDDYPAAALKKGVEGSVSFEVDVDPQGKATNCRVTSSSGDADLDRTTCELVLNKSRFIPAKDYRGEPMRGRYHNTANWMLQQDSAHAPDASEGPDVHPEGIIATPDWSDYRLYPMEARKNNHEGSVTAKLVIGSDGIPEECHIVTSSNFTDLDTGTCRLMMQMRFIPAHDETGHPVKSGYQRDVIWLLVDPRPLASTTLKVRARISGGVQTSCEVIGGEGPYVAAWTALACPLLRDLPYYFGAHASNTAMVSVEFRLDAGDGAVILNQPWDAAPVIASEKLSFVVDAEGDSAQCTPLEKYGFGPRSPTSTSPCPSLLRLLWFIPPKPGTRPRKGILETRVHLLEEEPGG